MVTIEVMLRVTFIVGVAVLAVEPVVPHSDISSLLPVAELDTRGPLVSLYNKFSSGVKFD